VGLSYSLYIAFLCLVKDKEHTVWKQITIVQFLFKLGTMSVHILACNKDITVPSVLQNQPNIMFTQLESNSSMCQVPSSIQNIDQMHTLDDMGRCSTDFENYMLLWSKDDWKACGTTSTNPFTSRPSDSHNSSHSEVVGCADCGIMDDCSCGNSCPYFYQTCYNLCCIP
jgi:hypothetical protein